MFQSTDYSTDYSTDSGRRLPKTMDKGMQQQTEKSENTVDTYRLAVKNNNSRPEQMAIEHEQP